MNRYSSSSGSRALPRLALRFANAVAIVRMQMLDEERGARVPLLEAVAENLLDLRAHVGRGLVGRVRRVDVRDQRQLLDEGAVARLRLLACSDVDEEALPVEAAAARVVHGHRAVLHPDHRPGLVVQPVLRFVRIHLALRPRDRAHHALAVERVDDLLEEERDLPSIRRANSRADRRLPG